MSDPSTRLACFVGAGYSRLAGLPLAADLFAERVYPDVGSSSSHIDAVLWDYWKWMRANPARSPEEYLSCLRDSLFEDRPLYDWAVEFIAARLAVPAGRQWSRRRYFDLRYHIRPIDPSTIAAHIEFWKVLLQHASELSIVTTNYDVLIEQAIRMKPVKAWRTPGGYYGGFSRPQILLGSQFRSRLAKFEVTGSIPIFKLHGSLNWAPALPGVEFYVDFRAAYRKKRRALIVPPASEKKPFDVLRPVWSAAGAALAAAETWVICGYSLPPYDLEIRTFLTNLSEKPRRLILVDPNAQSLAERWATVTGAQDVICLTGLPRALPRLARILSQLM